MGCNEARQENRSQGVDEGALHAIFRSAFPKRKGLSGPGDDCAVLEPPSGHRLVVSCDQVIEGVHLLAQRPAEVYAQKLLGRTLSDLAAAGARPWAVTWTVAAPKDRPAAWLTTLAEAFLAACRGFDLAVVGGDLAQAPTLVLTCTAYGLTRFPIPGRGGAKPGDGLWVSGFLGGAVLSDPAGRVVVGGRHENPQPRLSLGAWLTEHVHPTAMMDLSDGLGTDLPRLAARSGVGARVELDRLPLAPCQKSGPDGWRAALGDGEDYELLLTLPPAQEEQLGSAPAPGLTRIGEMVAGSGVTWMQGGRPFDLGPSGWLHRWGIG